MDMFRGRSPRGLVVFAVAWLCVSSGCALAAPGATGLAEVARSQPSAPCAVRDRLAITGNNVPATVPTYRGDHGRSGVMPGPGPIAAPIVDWQFETGEPTESSVAIDGELIVLATQRGSVIALDRADGTERWRVLLGTRVGSSPTIADGFVIVGSDAGVHALDVRDGRPHWTAADVGQTRGSPVVISELVVAATAENHLAAIDVATGELQWRVNLPAGISRSLAATEEMVVAGLEGGVIVAASPSDGSTIWSADLGVPGSIATPVVAAGRVFAAGGIDGTADRAALAALDALDGTELWRYERPEGGTVWPPAVSGDLAFVMTADGTIACLDARTGEQLWIAVGAGELDALPSLASGTVYGGTRAGEVVAVAAETGVELWRHQLQGVPFAPAVVDGRVFVLTSLGVLTAIGSSD